MVDGLIRAAQNPPPYLEMEMIQSTVVVAVVVSWNDSNNNNRHQPCGMETIPMSTETTVPILRQLTATVHIPVQFPPRAPIQLFFPKLMMSTRQRLQKLITGPISCHKDGMTRLFSLHRRSTMLPAIEISSSPRRRQSRRIHKMIGSPS